MSETVILPSGAEVVLRGPESVRQRDRRALLVALDGIEGSSARSLAASDQVLVLAVEKWTFDLPLPSEDVRVLDELTTGDYDALTQAAKPFDDAIFPDFSPTPDRDTPTEP
jgi:hypothetical protein